MKRSGLLLASFVAGGMIAQQVGGKVVRDALFLVSFPATLLPNAVIGAALLSLVAVLAMSRLMAKRGPGWIVPIAFVMNGSLFAVEWFLAKPWPQLTAAAIYLHTAAVGGLVISGFWSIITERFDPNTARHSISRITTGATLGGLLGGVLAERVGASVEPRAILLMLAVLNIGCAIAVRALGRETSSKPAARGFVEGISPLVRSPYLRNVALMIMLIALVEVFLEYALKAKAAEVFTDERGLVSFFAMFYTGASILTFVVQLALSDRSLDRLGLGGTLAVGPGIAALTAVVAGIFPDLWSIVVAAGLQAIIANSLFRASYELLFTPIAQSEKRPTKVIIDVAIARFGTMAGSGLILALVAWVLPVEVVVIFTAAGLAAIALATSFQIHGRYVRELVRSLEKGVISMKESDARDATTRRTIATTTMALDRDRLLAQIAALRGDQESDEGSVARAIADVADEERDDAESEILQIRGVTAGTPAEIREALESVTLEPYQVPFVAKMLARRDATTVELASKALTKVVDRVAGQLTDVFLDPNTTLPVRRRLPVVLRESGDARVVEALKTALGDEDFDVRFWSARALAKMQDRGITVDPGRDAILVLVRAEVSVDAETWRRRRDLQTDAGDRRGRHRGLEHAFALLSLVTNRDVMKLSLDALFGADARLRGTALEYLENTLPADTMELLQKRLERAD